MGSRATMWLGAACVLGVVWAAPVGCDRRKAATPPPPAAPSPATVPAPVAATPPAPPPRPTVVGGYKAEMRDPQTDKPFVTMLLALNADGTATLETKFPPLPNGAPGADNRATGRYAVNAARVTLTLEVGNGKPIPADDPKRVLVLDQSDDGRRLTNDTAGVPPFVRQD